MFRRLLVSYLALIGVTVALLAGIVNVATRSTFSRYLSDQALVHSAMLPVMLAGYHAQQGSWAGVQPKLDEASALIDAQVALADGQGRVVAATRGDVLGRTAADVPDLGLPMPVVGPDGSRTGTLYLGRSLAQRRADAQFQETVTRLLVLAGVAVAGVGGGLGWLLAQSISRPLRQMSQAADRLGQGDYGVRVPDFGADELGGLGRVINHMAEGMAGVEATRRSLVADVSHELRTPLTVIEGYLEGLRSGAIADYQLAARAFDAMYGETRRLLRLVRDLHYLSVIDGGLRRLDCRPVAVGELVVEAVAPVAPVAVTKGVTLDCAVASGLPLLSLDPERMAQVLTNLIENALRYTPAGGSIRVAVALADGDLVLTVVDTGQGIAPEHLPYLFERFYRADEARSLNGDGGAGIGLSIVKGIVEALGGSVGVASEPGAGPALPSGSGSPGSAAGPEARGAKCRLAMCWRSWCGARAGALLLC